MNVQSERKLTGMSDPEKQKILLMVLPLWDSLIPPLGMSCLKSFLHSHGYRVKTVDANINKDLKDFCDTYFAALKGFIPFEKRSNFYSLAYDAFADHMMAHLNRKDEEEYAGLVGSIVANTFYYSLTGHQVRKLSRIIADFYAQLEAYLSPLLLKEKPAVLGLTVFSSTLPASLFTFKLAKKIVPGIKTLIKKNVFSNQLAPGSPDLEFFLEKTVDYIDKLFIGEGELLFLKYLRGELPGSQRVYMLKDIEGRTLNIAELPPPDFSDMDLDFYNYLAFYGSRSCPMNCTFCSETIIWGKYRKKTPGQIVNGLKILNETHHSQLFVLCDSLLNPVASNLAKKLVKKELIVY
ncbi:hypothetical protein ACFLRB_01925 [Acidobacteriota bacterium]